MWYDFCYNALIHNIKAATMEGHWITIDEYARATGMERHEVETMIIRGQLKTSVEGDEVMIDSTQAMAGIVPSTIQELHASESDNVLGAHFVEKTIGTIISLHEKVLAAKDETIMQIHGENDFLKETVTSLQELYDEDRKTIETLNEQLRLAQQEVEFMRRKYKLMWGKVIDEYASNT